MRALEPGTPGELRDRLNSLDLAGTKSATTGLLHEYVRETERLEFVGERLALLDNAGRALATVEITGVEVKPFADVTCEHAWAAGEGDASLEKWRTVHRRFWERIGTPVEDRTPLVCLTFQLVERVGG